MKKYLFSLLAFMICGAAVVLADDSVRAVQMRLKQDGFYFGEVTGAYDSETAAAVSRFQIRNGLPITGQLDAATAKALGVATPGAVTTEAATADTWQRLRKTDRRFLTRQSSGQVAPVQSPASKKERRSGASPVDPPVAPLQPADGATLVLSRERLRDYVAAFVLAGLDPHTGAELEFFAGKVDYYGDGVVARGKIGRDLQRYAQQWPERRFWLAGQVEVQPQQDSRIRVTFPLRFDLRNGSKHSSGKVLKTLLLEVVGDDLQIVSVNERKA